MDRIKQRQNRGYLIVGIGAFVALLAFLLLPYTNVTLNCSSNCGSLTNFSLPLNATLIALATTAQSQSSGNFLSGSAIPFQGQGTLWFLPILTLAALVLTGFLVYRDMPFGKGMKAPVAIQKKWGHYALIGIAALGVLLQIVLLSNLGASFQNAYNTTSTSSITASAGGDFGFWFYILGMAAVVGGAILMLVQANKSALPLQVSYQQPPQPYQQPSDPYPQQNPIGQYPHSYPSQPPYPPVQ